MLVFFAQSFTLISSLTTVVAILVDSTNGRIRECTRWSGQIFGKKRCWLECKKLQRGKVYKELKNHFFERLHSFIRRKTSEDVISKKNPKKLNKFSYFSLLVIFNFLIYFVVQFIVKVWKGNVFLNHSKTFSQRKPFH